MDQAAVVFLLLGILKSLGRLLPALQRVLHVGSVAVIPGILYIEIQEHRKGATGRNRHIDVLTRGTLSVCVFHSE